ERLAERPCGEERWRERRPAARAVDDEGGERRGPAPDEVLLPARRATLGVVEGLVAEDASRDSADPAARDRSRQMVDIRRRERRVAEALQDQVAVPGRTGPRTGPVHLGVETVSRAEARQRDPRNRDLLVRRGCDRE